MLDMSKFTNGVVADNTVVVNGATFKVTDDIALKVLELVSNGIESVLRDNTKSSTSKNNNYKVGSGLKQAYTGNGFKTKYEVVKMTSVDGKELFCISRGKSGWLQCEKNIANAYIKALKNIQEISVEGSKNDGSKFTFTAWGYNTESTAKKHLKELPTKITPYMIEVYANRKELLDAKFGEE